MISETATRTAPSSAPVDLSTMRDPQDENVQNLVLDADRDAPVAGSVAPQRGRHGAFRGAPQRRPETARIVRHGEAFA